MNKNLDELRTAYQRIPAGTPSDDRVFSALPRLYAAIEGVLNDNPCKELGEAYVECQRLLIEARAALAGADHLAKEYRYWAEGPQTEDHLESCTYRQDKDDDCDCGQFVQWTQFANDVADRLARAILE